MRLARWKKHGLRRLGAPPTWTWIEIGRPQLGRLVAEHLVDLHRAELPRRSRRREQRACGNAAMFSARKSGGAGWARPARGPARVRSIARRTASLSGPGVWTSTPPRREPDHGSSGCRARSRRAGAAGGRSRRGPGAARGSGGSAIQAIAQWSPWREPIEREVELGSGRTRLRIEGRASPSPGRHGFTSSIESENATGMGALFGALPGRYRSCATTPRGHGRSAPRARTPPGRGTRSAGRPARAVRLARARAPAWRAARRWARRPRSMPRCAGRHDAFAAMVLVVPPTAWETRSASRPVPRGAALVEARAA